MKTIILILIFGVIITGGGYSQVALVLKSRENDREWPIGKGKKLTVHSTLYLQEEEPFIADGSLVSFTDSSLTLHFKKSNADKIIMFRNIDRIRVRQSGSGEFFAYSVAGLGLLGIVSAPYIAINGDSPYSFTEALVTFGVGITLSGLGFLMCYRYGDNYLVEGTCRTWNERYLRNKNGTYFFSLGVGSGASYGGTGFRLQARIGEITGVGFHVGAGWNFNFASNFDDKIATPGCFSVLTGVKFFPYRGWYVDAQFGNFGRIATVSYKDNIMIVHDTHTPYGFVYTAGGDWFFGRHFGLNLGAGMGWDLTAPSKSSTFSVFDMGFLIKF